MDPPAALRVRLSSERRVHAAIDRPINRIAQHRPFARGIAVTWDQDARLPWQSLHRMFRIRKIKNRHAADTEDAVVDLGFIADFEDRLARKKTPFRFGKFAGGDAAMRDDVAVWSL